MKLNEAVAARILEYCNNRNITVNSIFSGRSQNPKLQTIAYLCEGLSISLSEFFDSPLFSNLDD